ncbi:MAG: hypothetical protein ACI4HI_15700 [Lachnospiraceae bacterium]
MKKNTTCTDPEFADISIEEFDAMNETHTFSKQYEKNKKKMLRQYRKELLSPARHRSLKVAAAAAVVIIAAPIATNAATNGELFNRIWGTLGHKTIESHEEVIQEEGKEPFTVTFPKKEYEKADPDKAQELIGDSLSTKPIIKDIGDTRLTITSAVSDGNVAVVEFSLHRDGGVNCLNYSQLDNETKGAWFNDETSHFDFYFLDCCDNLYVDLERSTSDTLYCYDYMAKDVFGETHKDLRLKLKQYPGTIKEYYDNFPNPDTEDEKVYETYASQINTEIITIPIQKEVEKQTFASKGHGTVTFSSLGMKVNLSKALGLPHTEAESPDSLYYVAVNYKDGSKYVMRESDKEGVHDCPQDIDNTSYACEDINANTIYVFNRLIDTSQVESITFNETTYLPN